MSMSQAIPINPAGNTFSVANNTPSGWYSHIFDCQECMLDATPPDLCGEARSGSEEGGEAVGDGFADAPGCYLGGDGVNVARLVGVGCNHGREVATRRRAGVGGDAAVWGYASADGDDGSARLAVV